MGLSDKINNAASQGKRGPRPKLASLMEAVNEDDLEAMLGMLRSRRFSAPAIHDIFMSERAELMAAADEAGLGYDSNPLIDLYDVSAWCVKVWRREDKRDNPIANY